MNLLKKIGLGLTLLSLLVTNIIFLMPPAETLAQDSPSSIASDYGLSVRNGDIQLSKDDFTLTWIDAATIELRFKSAPDKPIIFTPNNSLFSSSTGRIDADGGYNVEYRAKNFGCYSFIGFDTNENDSRANKLSKTLRTGRLDIDFRQSAGGECTDFDGGEHNNVTLINPEKSIHYFVWVDGTRIEIADGSNPGGFTATEPGSTIFIRDAEAGASSCRDKLIYNPSNNTVRWYELDSKYSGTPPSDAQAGNCKYNEDSLPTSNVSWEVGRMGNREKPAGTGTTASGQVGGSAEEDNSCETNSGVLGWIMCPVAGVLDSIVGFLDEQIRGQLHLREDYFRDNGNGNPVKESWTQLRNIAYVILVPVMLVMVIGTALGFEVFSAYTIQKALPRMAIAVIFIALSWYICLFMVDLFNVMGAGIKGLITGPFSISNDQAPLKAALTNADVISQGSNTLESISSGITTGGLAVVGTVAAWSAGALSIGVIMSTLATAALVLGGVFLLLVARQIILIALFLLAPLAILSWIFPGNDKMWKLWWGSFSKLLMLFPLIMLLLGVGEVFAHITGAARSAADQNQLVTTIIVIGSFIMPFFFIPFAFKWAGGVFGNLAGMVNDSERGLLDRLKKGRSNMRERNIGNAKNFGRFKGTNRFTRGLNNLGGMATNRPGSYVSKESLKGIGRNKGLGRLGIDTDKLDGVRQAGQAVKAAEDLKNDKVYQTNQNDDKFLLALANRNHAVRMRDNALKEGDQAGAAAWSSALTNASLVKSRDHAGTKLAAISAHAATGYNLSPGQVGYNELAGSVIDALGVSPDDVKRDGAGNITGVTGAQAGNFASAMNQAQYNLKNAGRTDLGGINNGAGLDIKSGVRKLSNYQRGQGKKDTYHGGAGAWLGASAVDSETGKTAETPAEVARGIEASLASGQTTEDSIVEWHSMLLRDYHSATDANKLEIQKQIDAMESVRIVGDPTDISRGGNSNLVAKLAANRAALSREGTANIDPSEMEPK